jgi:hypothetical protein
LPLTSLESCLSKKGACRRAASLVALGRTRPTRFSEPLHARVPRPPTLAQRPRRYFVPPRTRSVFLAEAKRKSW